MTPLLDRLLDAPLSGAARDADLKSSREGRSDSEVVASLKSGIEHITNKSAALLQADSIFIAIALFAIQVARPSALNVMALVLLVFSCLLLASNLWAVWPKAFRHGDEAQLNLVYGLRITRGVRFNLALYLFFAGVVVLALGAIV